MAREGVRFRQFYNMAKCNPTRSSLHTGMFYGNERVPSLGKLVSAQQTNISLHGGPVCWKITG
jgi:arylsulfatase